jgi:hypothetical protein
MSHEPHGYESTRIVNQSLTFIFILLSTREVGTSNRNHVRILLMQFPMPAALLLIVAVLFKAQLNLVSREAERIRNGSVGVFAD